MRRCLSKDVLEHSEDGTSIIAVQPAPTEARIHSEADIGRDRFRHEEELPVHEADEAYSERGSVEVGIH